MCLSGWTVRALERLYDKDENIVVSVFIDIARFVYWLAIGIFSIMESSGNGVIGALRSKK